MGSCSWTTDSSGPTAGAWLITTCERTGTGSSMTSHRSVAAHEKKARPRVSLRSKPART
jgi:hypothetical protein